MRFWGIPIIAVVLLTGCSRSYNNSFYKEASFQKVSIHTPGLEYAHCTLKSGNNKYVILSPQTIIIEVSSKHLSVVCEKANYETIAKNIEPKYFGTKVIGNELYKYPDAIIVNMQPAVNERLAYLEPKYITKAYKLEGLSSVDIVLKRVNEDDVSINSSINSSADIEFSEDDEMYINKEKFKDRVFSKNEIAIMDLEEDKFPDMKISKESLKEPKRIKKVLK